MSQRPKALLAAWILAAAPALADSRIVVPEATREAGLVVKGETIRHTFLIRNEGTTDLHISEVRPSCGCTAAEFDRVVGPGKEGRVVLAVETRSFQGPISKSALVLSDDPVSPQTTLLIKADVKPFVDAVTPLTTQLPPLESALKQATPPLINSFKVLAYVTNELAYRPGGKNPGFLYWVAWFAHNANSFISSSDANGPVWRSLLLSTCTILKANAFGPVIETLLGTNFGCT